MDLILDTAALLSGRINSIPRGFDRIIITDLVKEEVREGNPRRNLEGLLEAGLRISDHYDTDAARRASRSTGDLEELSQADLSVIGLAISLEDPMVLTDDFRIQNVLASLNIEYGSAGEIGNRTISGIWEWTYRCRGCGRFYNDHHPDCPVCGQTLRKVKKKNTGQGSIL